MEEQFNIFNKIIANMEFYSSVEKKIANIILQEPNKFVNFSMKELSETAGVSQGSINNFSQKLINSGFSSLKLQIARQISFYEGDSFNVEEEVKGIKDVLEKKMHQNSVVMRNTIELNSEKVLQSAATKIMNAKKIQIFGIVHSGIIANDLYYRLLRLGMSASYINDVILGTATASMLDENDLVIAISSSGRTNDIIDAVRVAKMNNVPVISITGNKNSPLAKLSDDILITCSSGTTISSRSDEIKISQMFITDSLCSYITNKIDKDGENRFFKLSGIFNSHSIYD